MVHREGNRGNTKQYLTGIGAFGRAGLRWTAGGVFCVLGGDKVGKTALLLEIAMRHLEIAPEHSVRFLCNGSNGSNGSAAGLCMRLLRREVERKGEPHLLASESADRGSEARDRVWRLLHEERLQFAEGWLQPGNAPLGLPYTWPQPEPTLSALSPPPSLVVVDGDALTVSTPLQALQTTALAGVPPGTPAPPLVLSARVPAHHFHPRHRGALPYELLVSLQGLIDAADAVITLQREVRLSRAIRAHIRPKRLDVPATSVELMLMPWGWIRAE